MIIILKAREEYYYLLISEQKGKIIGSIETKSENRGELYYQNVNKGRSNRET